MVHARRKMHHRVDAGERGSPVRGRADRTRSRLRRGSPDGVRMARRTAHPSAASTGTKCRPTKPLAPVTSTTGRSLIRMARFHSLVTQEVHRIRLAIACHRPAETKVPCGCHGSLRHRRIADRDATRMVCARSSGMPGVTTQPRSFSVTVSAASASGSETRDDGPADREQIIEPARHRYACDILAIGNEPDIGGGKKLLEIARRPRDRPASHSEDLHRIAICFSRSKPIPQPDSRK